MFEFNPDLVVGDDEEADTIDVEREMDEEEESEIQIHDITNLAYVPTDVDTSGTQASVDRLAEIAANINTPMVNGADTDGKFALLLTFDLLTWILGSKILKHFMNRDLMKIYNKPFRKRTDVSILWKKKIKPRRNHRLVPLYQ